MAYLWKGIHILHEEEREKVVSKGKKGEDEGRCNTIGIDELDFVARNRGSDVVRFIVAHDGRGRKSGGLGHRVTFVNFAAKGHPEEADN